MSDAITEDTAFRIGFLAGFRFCSDYGDDEKKRAMARALYARELSADAQEKLAACLADVLREAERPAGGQT